MPLHELLNILSQYKGCCKWWGWPKLYILYAKLHQVDYSYEPPLGITTNFPLVGFALKLFGDKAKFIQVFRSNYNNNRAEGPPNIALYKELLRGGEIKHPSQEDSAIRNDLGNFVHSSN